MAYKHPPIRVVVTSAAGAAVPSKPIHVGGQDFSVFVTGPAAALVSIEVSEDQSNWAVANRKELSTAITAVTPPANLEILDKPTWARLTILLDAGGPRVFEAVFSVKQSGMAG